MYNEIAIHPLSNPDTCARFVSGAHWMLQSLMLRKGNSLSDDLMQAHRDAIRASAEVMRGAHPVGRVSVNLPCGAGKTTSITAIVSMLHRLNLLGGVSVAVCCASVEGLADVHRNLENAGVPSNLIGLSHSLKHDPENLDPLAQSPGHASMPNEPKAAERPVILMTQQRLRGKHRDDFLTYRGFERDLVLWDEACIVSTAAVVPWYDFTEARGGIHELLQDVAPSGPALHFLDFALARLKEELQAQETGASPTAVVLTGHDLEAVGADLDALAAHARTALRKDITGQVETLKNFLAMAANDIRILFHGKGEGTAQAIISYTLDVPPYLKRLVVFDGSATVSALSLLDKGIQPLGIPEDLKDYSRVTTRLAKLGSGHKTLKDDMGPRGPRRYAAMAVEAIRAHMDEHSLIVCHRRKDAANAIDFPKEFREALEAAGLRPDEPLSIRQPDGSTVTRPRVEVITWGRHKAVNHYVHCTNVVLLGVQHLAERDLRAMAAAQAGDVTYTLKHTEMLDALASVCAGDIFQALARGRMRLIVNEREAPAMTAWLSMDARSNFRTHLDKVTPGMRWEDWHPEGTPGPARKTQAAQAVAERLRLSKEIAVSSRRLWADLGYSEDVKKDAKPLIPALVPDWKATTRGWARA
jgi:hypothetical protein